MSDDIVTVNTRMLGEDLTITCGPSTFTARVVNITTPHPTTDGPWEMKIHHVAPPSPSDLELTIGDIRETPWYLQRRNVLAMIAIALSGVVLVLKLVE